MRGKLILGVMVLSLAGVGCGGQIDQADEVGEENATRPGSGTGGSVGPGLPVPAATPEVSWQFYGCLTPDQRSGLQTAMLHLAKSIWDTGLVFGNSGTASVCGADGDERGGVFRDISNTGGRIDRGVAAINVRPGDQFYAFAVSQQLLATVAKNMFAYVALRFDAKGQFVTDGRFEITNFGAKWNEMGFQVLDHQTLVSVPFVATDLPSASSPPSSGVQCNQGPLQPVSDADTTGPFLSKDPLKQNILNATKQMLANSPQQSGMAVLLMWGPACTTTQAIDLVFEPSLAGWPLPFERVTFWSWFGPVAGPLVASGGYLIR
jgi:hypothetical protein